MRRSWLIYAVVYSFFLATLGCGNGYAEVRKLTQEDVEWAGTPINGTVTVTSAGGHVGHPFPVLPYVSVMSYIPTALHAGIAAGTDTTDLKSYIDTALSTNKLVVLPDGTYNTTGSHTVGSGSIVGASKLGTIIKRLSGTNTMFTASGTGGISNLTLDGNSLGGAALIVTENVRSKHSDILLKNVAGTSYALRVEQGVEEGHNKVFEDLEFSSNYGHIYLGYNNYTRFYRTKMFGNTTGYAIYFSNLDVSRIKFYDTYMESGIAFQNTGVRDITFDGLSVYLSASWDHPWMTCNYATGSEVAQVQIRDMWLQRNAADNTNVVFDVSTYQLLLENIHIYDALSTGWSVFKDTGTWGLRIKDFTVESSAAGATCNLFSSDSTGGRFTIADGLWYQQGSICTAAWSDSVDPAKTSGHITVRNSNFNHSIRGSTARGFLFENIFGDVDLTNAVVGGTVLFNINGTVTDPNNAVSLRVEGSGVDVQINPYYTYDNNAAAVAAGKSAGLVVKATGDADVPKGVLIVVTP